MAKVGRPLYTVEKMEDLKPNWQEEVLELASKGASEVEIRALLDISQELFYRWLKDEPKFSITIKKAKELCRVWWESEGRVNLKDQRFSATLWYMNMKNRFGWADKTENKNENNNRNFQINEVKQYNSSDGETDDSNRPSTRQED